MQLGPLSSLMKRKYHSKGVKAGIENSKDVSLEHSQEVISHITIISHVTIILFQLLLFGLCFVVIIYLFFAVAIFL